MSGMSGMLRICQFLCNGLETQELPEAVQPRNPGSLR